MLPDSQRPTDLDKMPEPEHPTTTTKTLNKFFAVALVVVAIALGVFLKWSFESSAPLVVNNSPFPARVESDPTGKTGGTIYLTVDFCKNTDKHGQVRWSYLSASREQFVPIVEEKFPKGCDKREIPVVIPTNLSQDTYIVKFRVTYDLNPIKKNVPVEFESQPVNISKTKVENKDE